jgi:hypothetical protein
VSMMKACVHRTVTDLLKGTDWEDDESINGAMAQFETNAKRKVITLDLTSPIILLSLP